jgi:hypothetical protein
VTARTELSNYCQLRKSQQIDFIPRIDISDFLSNEHHILEEDSLIFLPNIEIRSGLAKGDYCHAVRAVQKVPGPHLNFNMQST